MFATRTKNAFSSPNRTVNQVEIETALDYELLKGADAWDSYTSTISEAIIDALTARTIALRDYAKVQALADISEKQLQKALTNSDLARESLLHKTACEDRAYRLKNLIDQYSVQVSILKSQLAFWQNQLA